MQGVITDKDAIDNLLLIWREFGAGCLIRCLAAMATGKGGTFLEIAVRLS